MRRKLVLPLTIVLLTAMMSGCSTADRHNSADKAGHGSKSDEDLLVAERMPSHHELFTLKALSNTPLETPDLNNRFWTRIQEMFQVKLQAEFIPLDDYDRRLRLVLSSGDLPEVMVLNTIDDSVFNKAVKQGLFWDVNELAGNLESFPNLKHNISETAWKYTKIEGRNYVIPRARPLLDGGLHWRPDLFNNLGLPQPRTLDEYVNSLKKIMDTNPDKRYVGLHFEEAFFNAFGGFETVYNNEGGLIYKYFTDSYTEFVKWYRHVYSMGLMSKEFAILKGSDKENMFRSDKALTYFRNMYHSYTYEQELKRIDPNYEAGVITYLNGPKGHSGEYGMAFTGGFVIARSVPKDKALRILQMYNQAAAPEVTDQLLRGFEGVHYNKVDGKRIPTELAKKELNNAVMQIFPNADDEWQKVVNYTAPKEWNDKMKAVAQTLYEAEEKIDPFRVIRSETWLKQWPKVQDDYISIRTQAVMGLIPMEEYEDFVKKYREKPEFKKAFKEFADSYELMMN
ncbi:extracellular solute-binding protein [Paenibacillus radicis (ex Xue et al. 2023)]|uniref:Extracellular solute-binding protein n=1 Tax=Paenibacillus radicis (ex Xue et al. 2023) TaxID=2972489 RepID=A0ABT1YIT9_9BACL|nr:extracellular solute-binding protein [Paenibacillus radicis (ex Xue et al. 2023)]MCR8632892.1 extracellular solute-binding protein [Paenibacillus radicis (ex Xue et al. 2023)]